MIEQSYSEALAVRERRTTPPLHCLPLNVHCVSTACALPFRAFALPFTAFALRSGGPGGNANAAFDAFALQIPRAAQAQTHFASLFGPSFHDTQPAKELTNTPFHVGG